MVEVECDLLTQGKENDKVNWDNRLPNPNLNVPMVELVAHICT
jgi:hypothetical protein